MAERVEGGFAEPQEQPGRQSRRAPRVGLRLVAIGQDGIEDMRSEARLGGVPAAPVAVAKERMQPSVCLSPFGEVIDQLDMAVPAAQRVETVDLVQIERSRMSARQPPEGVPQHLPALRVINQGGDWQI